jgi:hypothetical protein
MEVHVHRIIVLLLSLETDLRSRLADQRGQSTVSSASMPATG